MPRDNAFEVVSSNPLDFIFTEVLPDSPLNALATLEIALSAPFALDASIFIDFPLILSSCFLIDAIFDVTSLSSKLVFIFAVSPSSCFRKLLSSLSTDALSTPNLMFP